MLFKSIIAGSAFVFLANAQANPTTLSFTPAEATQAEHNLEAYITSIAKNPIATSAYRAVTSAAPSGAFTDSDFVQEFATATAEPTWWSDVPDKYQAYWTSVAKAEASILVKAAEGPAPTHAPKIAGAILAAGGAALAFL